MNYKIKDVSNIRIIIFVFFQLRDLNLGTQFPTIKGLEVADSKIDADTGLLESLDLSLDLHYSGNFQLSIDVRMLLGKTAYMALQGIIKKYILKFDFLVNFC